MKTVMRISLLFTLLCTIGFINKANGQTILVEPDNTSTYKPTQIINGNFDSPPWMSYSIGSTTYSSYDTRPSVPDRTKISASYPNGVNGGWNTTETETWHGMLFEFLTYIGGYNPNITSDGNYVEMNCYNNAVLSQDLKTHENDVIRWSLQHAVRTYYGPDIQSMRVEIGSPEYNGENIVAASGIDEEINSHITTSSKATYTASGYSGTYACGGVNLNHLALNKTMQNNKWYSVQGIYLVPAGQVVTRFAFIATSETMPDGGNLLDNLTFSTLIGNLSAVNNEDGSVTIKGYWGETNTSKSLRIEIGSETYDIDMSAVTDQNFMITIPGSAIGSESVVTVYHQDFYEARRTVELVKEGIEISSFGYCDGSSHSIRYHLNSGKPDQYKIDYSDSRFTDVTWTNLDKAEREGAIEIFIPADIPTGDYTMTVTFRNSRSGQWKEKAFTETFHVNLPASYTMPLFEKTIVLIDTCDCMSDVQWYHRDNSTEQWQPIPDATNYYYYSESKLSGEYFVSVKMNGVPTFTCPQTDMETLYTDNNNVARVKAFPNPVGDITNIVLEGMDAGMHTLHITNMTGETLLITSFEGTNTTINMDGYSNGNYLVSVDGIMIVIVKL